MDWDNREAVLLRITKRRYGLMQVNEKLRGDREVALAAISNYGDSLRYASAVLRNDRYFVLNAIERNIYAIYYIEPQFKCDKEVILAAIRQSNRVVDILSFLKEAPQEIYKDESFLWECWVATRRQRIYEKHFIFTLCSDEIRENLRKDPFYLELFAPMDIKPAK